MEPANSETPKTENVDPKPEKPKVQPLSGKKVKIQSSDNKEFEIAVEYAEQSTTIKNMMEDLPDDQEIIIPLPNISSVIMEKIIVYWEYHWVNPLPIVTDPRVVTEITPWDGDYVNVAQQILFELVLAANFLDIKPLLDLCCKTMANVLIQCKDPEDIRKYLNIKNDFTPEEEEAIRKENEWCLAE